MEYYNKPYLETDNPWSKLANAQPEELRHVDKLKKKTSNRISQERWYIILQSPVGKQHCVSLTKRGQHTVGSN